MTSEDITIFFQYLEAEAKGDPGAIHRLLHLTRTSAPSIVEGLLNHEATLKRERAAKLPSLSDITSAQITLYDNWQATGGIRPSRKRGEVSDRKERFKATMTLWTSAQSISTASAAATVYFALMDQPERCRKIAALSDPSKSKANFASGTEEWQDFGDTVMSIPEDYLAGPGAVRTMGTTYPFGCFAMMQVADSADLSGDMRLVVQLRRGEVITFHSFTDTYAGAGGTAPLQSNAVLSSRLAIGTHHAAWRTGVLYRETEQPAVREVVIPPITSDDVPY